MLQKLASSFHSGKEHLDHFLQGSQALDVGLGKTYVFLSEDNRVIIGYYNIGVGYIEQITKSGNRKIGGSAHINCFALDEKYHGLLQYNTPDGIKVNLSDVLLNDCIRRIDAIRSEQIGFSFVTLCATQQGYSLYKRNDFDDLDGDLNFSTDETDKGCILMYLPLDYE